MFHKKIEKIQRDVDEMLDLYTEPGEEGDHQELGEMILKAQDGNLNKRGYKKLGKRLTSDLDALRYYVDFQAITVLLCEHFDKSWPKRMLDGIKEHVFVGSV